jgi:hypothetical protein
MALLTQMRPECNALRVRSVGQHRAAHMSLDPCRKIATYTAAISVCIPMGDVEQLVNAIKSRIALCSELLCLAGESTFAAIIGQGRIDSQGQRIIHFYICPTLR